MRSIKTLLHNRILEQKKELEIQAQNILDNKDLLKTAEILDSTLNSTSIRKNEDFYSYSNEEYQKDIENYFWQIIIRTADYYDTNIDLLEMQELICKFASEFEQRICNSVKAVPGVGAYEPTIPGEVKYHTTLEIEE